MATKLLDPVKTDLGITHSKKDNDIQDAIETAKQRLSQIGVNRERKQQNDGHSDQAVLPVLVQLPGRRRAV